MKFNIGDWIVGVLKLIRDSKWLRRLLYVMFFVFGTPAVGQAYSNIKGITIAVLEPEQANQLVKEAGKAFALPAGVMGGIITTENDVIRIFGITLFNWLLIISAIYSLIQIFFFQAMSHSRSSHNLGQQHRDQARRKTFMFEYSFRGLTFGFDTSAETEAEARERLKAMQAAQIVCIGYQDDRIDFLIG